MDWETKKVYAGNLGKPKEQIDIRHFAFECDPYWVLNESVAYLKKRKIKCRIFLNNGTERPMVFVWIPAISIYFNDPDGHSLEFIGILDGKSKPVNGVVPYEEWMELITKEK